MLILSRKPGETIVINDEVQITIVQIKDDKVRVGINAPQEMPVHRKESLGSLTPFNGDSSAQIIEQLSKELETARQEAAKYKSHLIDILRSEWDDVTQKDLDEATHSGFDAEEVIHELMQGSAA